MALARWKNGVEVSKEECIEVLMWYFGEDAKDAEQDLFTISRENLQTAVDYYCEKEV